MKEQLRRLKEEIEKDGLIATIDEALERLPEDEHECGNDNIDGTDGTCTVCGETNLI